MARNKTVASKTKPQIDILPCKVPLRTMTARQPEGKPPPDSFEFRSKMAALYTAVWKQNITLHDAYNMPKCPEELNCSECGNFYTHLNSLRLHTRVEDDEEIDEGRAGVRDDDEGERAGEGQERGYSTVRFFSTLS